MLVLHVHEEDAQIILTFLSSDVCFIKHSNIYTLRQHKGDTFSCNSRLAIVYISVAEDC